MGVVMTILFMVAIGAIIGGLTNSLAIKMLFRPYEAKYIGRIKLPFTPGLIPKRQSELARQMGRTVVQHLLTPEGMKKKFANELFYRQVYTWAEQEVKRIADKNDTVQELFNKLGFSINFSSIENFTQVTIEKKLKKWMTDNRHVSLRMIIPSDLLDKSEKLIPKVSTYILDQFDLYISSQEGKDKIGAIAERYLGGRGFFGNMISSFLGGDGLASKIQPAISQYLRTEDAHQMIHNLLEKEWTKLLDKNLEEMEPAILNLNLSNNITNLIGSFLSVEKILQTNVKEYYEKYESIVHSFLLPKGIKIVQSYLVEKIADLMERLKLEEIVKDEVEHFDVKRLEEMVLGISKRELKMITYLGALLGGLIGFIQGVYVLLVA